MTGRTHIAVLLDRWGSMDAVRDDAEEREEGSSDA